MQAEILRQDFLAQLGVVLNFFHARQQRAQKLDDRRAALFQHAAAHRRHVADDRKVECFHVEDGLETGAFQYHRVGGIENGRGNAAVFERQHSVVLTADGRHPNVSFRIHAETLQRKAKIKVRHVVNPRDADNFSFELLDLVDAGRGDDAVLHAIVDARDELQIGAARHGADDIVRNTVQDIDLTGDQCRRCRIALNPNLLDIESFARIETGVLCHPQRQYGPADIAIADAELVGGGQDATGCQDCEQQRQKRDGATMTQRNVGRQSSRFH